MDDTTVTAEGKDLEDAFKKLENIITKQGGVMEWAKTHDCQFVLNKFRLVGFTRRQDPSMAGWKKTTTVLRPPIVINQHTVQPTTTHKFLGMIIDQELRFKEHANYTLVKGTKFIDQYQQLERVTKGVAGRFMRKF